MPIITYNGLPVGSTQGSEPTIGRWIAQNIRPEEIFPVASPQWPGFLTGGPVLNQTPYPWDHVAIDRLWWPWGASRFAHVHVVVDDFTLGLIRNDAYSNQKYKALTFTMDDGAYQTPISTNLWMLPARPLSTAAPGGNALYLLTLVDDRYFWPETSLQYAVTVGTTAWTDLYTAIQAALGITINADPINAAYGKPTLDYVATYQNTAMILDAVALSVGQHIVRKLDGTVLAQNPTTALANQTAQQLLWASRKRRGGVFSFASNQPNDLSALVPATVEVVYRTSGDGATADVGYWPSTTTLAALNLTQFPQPQVSGQPWTKVLHRFEIASFAGGTSPTNATTLNALTAQFATDWLLWQLASQEQWYVGTVPWTLDGLNDAEWRGMPLGECVTHIRRRVFNPLEDLVPIDGAGQAEVYLAKTTSVITGRVGSVMGKGTAEIYGLVPSGSDEVLTDENIALTIYNLSTFSIQTASGNAGVWIEVMRDPFSKKLVAIYEPLWEDQCDVDGVLGRYISLDEGVTWALDVVLSRPITFFEPDTYCASDNLLHHRQRLISTGGCANSIGPWQNDVSMCVPCCQDHPSGYSSGQSGQCVSVTVPCCENPLPCQLCVQVTGGGALNGNYLGVYSTDIGAWQVTIGTCTVYFACNPETGSLFQIQIGQQIYDSANDQCTWLMATFTSVDLSGCGGTSGAQIQVTTGPCPSTSGSSGTSGGTGTIATTCCPNPLPKTLCISVVSHQNPELCPCVEGQYDLAYINLLGAASWTVSEPSKCAFESFSWTLSCNHDINGNPTWALTFTVGGLSSWSASCPLTCSPVTGTFTFPAVTCPGDGGSTALTVTLSDQCGAGCNAIVGTGCCADLLLCSVYNAAFGGSLSGLGNVAITYVPANNWWKGSSSACGGTNVVLRCLATPGGSKWELQGVTGVSDGTSANGNPFGAFASSSSCVPFMAVFSFQSGSFDCPGAATCTVS